MPFELSDLPTVEAPQSGSAICACGSKLIAIGTEADTVDRTLMPFELILFLNTLKNRSQG